MRPLFVRIFPGDVIIMKVKKQHMTVMTRQEMDAESTSLQGKLKCVEPIVTNARRELCGDTMRAVRFFSPNRHSV